MLANHHRAGAEGDSSLPAANLRLPSRPLSESESALVDHAVSVLRGVSRTFSGISDTSTSADKPKLLLEGPALADAVERNFRTVLGGLIPAAPLDLEAPADVLALLRWIAVVCNAGLVPEERPLLRSWETGIAAHTAPADLERDLFAFAGELIDRYPGRSEDPVAFAAWIEQALNGRIHPFSDGCGRVSRVLATFVLAEAGLPLPRYGDRKEFFDKINLPFPEWLGYYRGLAVSPAP